MINERYRIAMAETLHYLKGIKQDDINKIPNDFMTFLKNNASQNYKNEFDYTKPLKELNLKNETRGLIAMICLNYWCETEEQKDTFRRHLNKNEIKCQEELSKKYNTDNIFKKKELILKDETMTENTDTNRLIIQSKQENAFKRLFKKFKKIFHIK